jgi:hypothetical protein
LRYPEGLRGAAFGGAAAISAEGDAEGGVPQGTGPNEMIYDGNSNCFLSKERRIEFED